MITKLSFTTIGTYSILATVAAAQSATSREIDTRVWAPVSAAVARDDLAALGPLYHPAAVVVTPSGTARIQAKVKQWVDDANSTAADLDSITHPDEQAWAQERASVLIY